MIIDSYRYVSGVSLGNGSIEFDGVNQYVRSDLTIDNYITSIQDFSASMWFKGLSSGSTRQIWSMYTSSSRYITIDHTSAGFVRWNVRGLGGLFSFISAIDVDDNAWHHFCFVADSAAANKWVLYLDGASVYTNTTSINVNAYDEVFVAALSTGAQYFDGRCAQMALYDAPLSSGDVTAIYNGGSITDITALSSYSDIAVFWQMNDSDTLPVITDSSGNGYGGTAFNTPTISADEP